MLKLEPMFEKLFPGRKKTEENPASAETDLEVSFAALLVEAARSDEDYADHEKAIIDKTLGAKFEVTPDEAAALREKGEAAQANALDIQRFTRHAKTMGKDDKIALIEQLWEIVLSDGVRDPFEDTLIRRICGLIYVDDRDSGEARARVEAKLAGN